MLINRAALITMLTLVAIHRIQFLSVVMPYK